MNTSERVSMTVFETPEQAKMDFLMDALRTYCKECDFMVDGMTVHVCEVLADWSEMWDEAYRLSLRIPGPDEGECDE